MAPTSLLQREMFFLLALTSLCSWIGSSPLPVSENTCSPDADIYLEKGSALELYCSVDARRPDFAITKAVNIVFYDTSGERVSNNFISVVNDTTARLYMENATESDEYSCKLIAMNDFDKNASVEERAKPIFREELLCTYKVFVGSKPQRLSRVSCGVADDWNSVNCSWEPRENDIPTTYELSIILNPFPSEGRNTSASYRCPPSTDNRCLWTPNPRAPYRTVFKPYVPYTLLFTGHNRLGDMELKATSPNFDCTFADEYAGFCP